MLKIFVYVFRIECKSEVGMVYNHSCFVFFVNALIMPWKHYELFLIDKRRTYLQNITELYLTPEHDVLTIFLSPM